MKIGILTFHNAYNYGAVLQAYALQTFLIELGHQVEIIDYRNTQVEKSYALFRFRPMPKRNPIKFAKYWATQIHRSFRYPLFHKSVQELLILTPEVKTFHDKSLLDKDVIIVGSDQLWNKKITNGFDSFYWGEFVHEFNGKLITYAVCMNTEKLLGAEKDYIVKHLANFHSLSVREIDLANIIGSLTNKTVNISLDPTLLVGKKVWRDMISGVTESKEEPYVLVYAILQRKKVIETAKNFAKRNSLRLKIMDPIADIKPFNRHYQPTDPVGFINAIAHAQYVITSSFHGMVFSVIFNREVYVMGDSGKNERMRSLLNALGIGDRFIDDSRQLTGNKIDYSAVEKKLYTLRKESQDYLITAING